MTPTKTKIPISRFTPTPPLKSWGSEVTRATSAFFGASAPQRGALTPFRWLFDLKDARISPFCCGVDPNVDREFERVSRTTEEPPHIRGDKRRLLEVVLNLNHNADQLLAPHRDRSAGVLVGGDEVGLPNAYRRLAEIVARAKRGEPR